MTIKEIAKLAGVSVSTVSRVLNNHPNVSPEARERVLKIIEEYHFVPHAGAVDLVKTRSDSIGMIVRGRENTFFSEITPLLENEVSKLGYNLVVEHIHSVENELETAVRLVKSKRLKGVILLGGRFDYTPEDIAFIDVPLIFCTFTNSFGKINNDKYSSISIDDEMVGYEAVHYLVENGHKKIAIVLPSCADHSVSELRFQGYCKALTDHGLRLDESLIIQTERYSMSKAYASVKKLIDNRKEFDALFAVSDSMAVASIKALNDCGRKVPDDCSVLGVDGINLTKYTIPQLTTYEQPSEQIAKETAKLLDDVLKEKPHRHIIVKTNLRTGESVQIKKA